jgi:hypothetical protein
MLMDIGTHHCTGTPAIIQLFHADPVTKPTTAAQQEHGHYCWLSRYLSRAAYAHCSTPQASCRMLRQAETQFCSKCVRPLHRSPVACSVLLSVCMLQMVVVVAVVMLWLYGLGCSRGRGYRRPPSACPNILTACSAVSQLLYVVLTLQYALLTASSCCTNSCFVLMPAGSHHCSRGAANVMGSPVACSSAAAYARDCGDGEVALN